MKRLTFDGNFCVIAMCMLTPGGSYCEDGACSQRKAWERLKAIEDILGDEYDLERMKELIQADRERRVLPEGSGWFVTCSGKKLTIVADIEAALRREQDD